MLTYRHAKTLCYSASWNQISNDPRKTLVAFANSVRPDHAAVILIGECDNGLPHLSPQSLCTNCARIQRFHAIRVSFERKADSSIMKALAVRNIRRTRWSRVRCAKAGASERSLFPATPFSRKRLQLRSRNGEPIDQKRASSVEVIKKQVQPVSLHTR